MSDEEKAEEYANNEINKMFVDESEEVYVRASTLKQIIKNSHLKGLAEGRKEMFSEAVIKNLKENTSVITSVIMGKLSEKCEQIEKENAELKAQISTLLSCSNCPDNKGGYICAKEYNNKCLAQKIQYIKELKEELEKMKKKCLDVMRVHGISLTDDYMAGMYNGMVVIYNSCFLDRVNELEKSYCLKNENGKWEKVE